MNFKRKPQVVEAYNPETFDVTSLEAEIAAEMNTIQRYAPPASVEEIGTVTAEAVMAQHEALAKTVEEMREPIKDLATKHQNALADLAAAMTYIDETAQRCRTVGENSRDHIRKSSETIAECRALCDAVRAKIDPPQ